MPRAMPRPGRDRPAGPRGPRIGGLCFGRDDRDGVCSDLAAVGPDVIDGVRKAFGCIAGAELKTSSCTSVGGDSAFDLEQI